MATGNPILGTLRGSIGDVTVQRRAGKQVSRVRVRNPKNPQTVKQTVQRVLLAMVAQAYSFSKEVCRGSFEGASSPSENQSRFLKLNLNALRADAVKAVGDDDRSEWRYVPTMVKRPTYNKWMVSTGKLTSPLHYEYFDTRDGFTGGASITAADTYATVCQKLGVSEGDQVSVAILWGRDETEGAAKGFEVARVIMMPSTGNMNDLFLAERAEGQEFVGVNHPNALNEGTLEFDFNGYIGRVEGHEIIVGEEVFTAETNKAGAVAVVISHRNADGSYSYSNSQFAISERLTDFGLGLTDVINPAAGDLAIESEIYVDNAV